MVSVERQPFVEIHDETVIPASGVTCGNLIKLITHPTPYHPNLSQL